VSPITERFSPSHAVEVGGPDIERHRKLQEASARSRKDAARAPARRPVRDILCWRRNENECSLDMHP
jgi:hypothetical protein